MGLCKCPKRKVTNLFCFEHRVNVCESCLMTNHETCVVQTYLSWLTDSDYDPNCLICSQPFITKEVVRLKCLHIFHWQCLNARASSLPNNTAPAGYKCPSCLDILFPSENQSSPVVDKLREKLQTVNWARIGLGMSLISESESNSALLSQSIHSHQTSAPQTIHYSPNQGISFSSPSQAVGRRESFSINMAENHNHHEPIYEQNSFSSRAKLLPDAHRQSSRDENEDESNGRIARIPRSIKRLILVLLMLTLVYFLLNGFTEKEHRQVGEDNPLFDPHANPHIKFEAKEN